MGNAAAALEAWDRVGRDLLSVDPARFASLVALAERIIETHRDPLSFDLPLGSGMPLDEESSGSA
jgi:hypothetical protein